MIQILRCNDHKTYITTNGMPTMHDMKFACNLAIPFQEVPNIALGGPHIVHHLLGVFHQMAIDMFLGTYISQISNYGGREYLTYH